ncbi:hypothetical protein [Carnobacterium sp.]|uniref:hypothetical protein n=1 Tax=Carnobacterium sp. TaxID=48221 RepID=UPI0028A5DE43|nr:hypothetical protein [Carnobacterium sp.]
MGNKNIGVDSITGEIIEGAVVITPEQQDAYNKHKIKKATIEANSDKKTFSFQKMDKMKGVDCLLTLKQWGYFCVLSSYIDYDNMLKMAPKSKVPMTQKEMRGILKISKQDTLRTLLKTLKENKLLIEKKIIVYGTERTAFFLSSDLIFKKSVVSRKSGKNTAKIWTDSVKDIYEDSKVTLTDLGFIFKVIPYLNVYHNFLTHNIDEEDPSKDTAITQADLASILGIDKATVTKKIRQTKWNDMFVFAIVTVNGVQSIKMNPLVAYRKVGEPNVASYAEFFLK